MTLSESLAAISSIAQSASFAVPPGVARDVAAIIHASAGIGARLAQQGRTRTQIVEAIRRVPDIEERIAEQDAEAARLIAARFGEEP
jgi:hypothetical protein